MTSNLNFTNFVVMKLKQTRTTIETEPEILPRLNKLKETTGVKVARLSTILLNYALDKIEKDPTILTTEFAKQLTEL